MDKRLLIPLFVILLISLASSSHSTDYKTTEPEYTEVNPLDMDKYSTLDDRIKNSGFSEYTQEENKKADFRSWNENHGSTHHIGVFHEGSTIDGATLKTRWIQNGFNAKASISQEVNLTNVDAVKLDVTGTGGNPHRSKIVLKIDGKRKGTFIKSPQRRELYRDLAVNLKEEYRGVHTVRIKWVQIMGDNIGNSGIDNVKALSARNEETEKNNDLVKKQKLDIYYSEPSDNDKPPYNRSKIREPNMPTVEPSIPSEKINTVEIKNVISILQILF